ncbi:MAG: 30S ribosome-binding factor RbfA [Dehalococcoidia bacterium]|nr:30S ribosome-binding factor RbfA [Dehalococcoidia bacterium]
MGRVSARRLERLSHQLREDISYLLRREISDPRLGRFISVTQVVISPDLKLAKIFVSVVGGEAEKRETLKGFQAATGFLRMRLSRLLDIRQVPELSFQLDESIEDGERVLDLINRLDSEVP